MGNQLHEALKSLCFNTCWNYAVFWKFEQRAQVVLTCEDAYYGIDGHSDASQSIAGNPYDGQSSRNSLGLAVAKMSLHVYSLGEGIVGKVAITDRHMWISTDKHVLESCSLVEYSDGLLPQFSSGIRTIAVVPVVPHGVVQLGSLDIIAEDLMLVNHIRDTFSDFCAPLAGPYSSIDSSPCLSSVSTRTSVSRNHHDCIHDAGKTVNKQKGNTWYCVVPSVEIPSHHSYTVPTPEAYPRNMVSTIKDDKPEYTVLGENSEILPLNSMYTQKQLHVKLTSDKKSDGQTSGFRDVRAVSGCKDNDTTSPCNYSSKSSFNNVAFRKSNFGVDISYLSSAFQDPTTGNNHSGLMGAPEISQESQVSSVNTSKLKTEANHMDICETPFRFSAGCELYEALGPSFKKHNINSELEKDKTESGALFQTSDGRTSSHNLMLLNAGAEHLLEAVVANICPSVSDITSENSKLGSRESLLTFEKMLEPSTSDNCTIGSTSYLYDRFSRVEDCLVSSEAYGSMSSKGFSSTSPSRCSEQLERPQELTKMNKKRARPGENCRPRPRDRQLIQDRIKELRELVPNGSKCSIDSLLERTIKHILFMQCTTQHAEKLQKYAESKALDQETGVHGSSSYGQGSSWAVELESHLRVFPIKVENINMNGQMYIEMLCENYSHFFKIAEAIRSLGMTILKGATEAYDEKRWICFVVEGQNNRNVHRMDILLSLVQILQPKIDA